MAIINPWSAQLINSTAIDVPLLQNVASLVNALYVLTGGLVGVWAIFMLFKLRESIVMKRRLDRIERDVRYIRKTVDALVKKKH